MARATFVKAARKAIPGSGIKKGDSYWWWKFRFGGRICSKNKPRRSQLTQSGYLSTLYDLQDQVSDLNVSQFNEPDDLDNWKGDFISELESLRDEQEEKRSNMPEQLQDSNSGEMLQERYESLDNTINELESIDCNDFDFDEADAADTIREENTDEDGCMINDDEVQEQVNTKRQEAVNEWLQEKIDEIQGISIGE